MERVDLIPKILRQHQTPTRVLHLSDSFNATNEEVRALRNELAALGLLKKVRGYGPSTVYTLDKDRLWTVTNDLRNALYFDMNATSPTLRKLGVLEDKQLEPKKAERLMRDLQALL